MEEKKYVPNDVWKFSVVIDDSIADRYVCVYTNPIPPDEQRLVNDLMWTPDPRENLVKEKYFTQERIDEMKRELIKRIEECENPFIINCVDKDGNYNVTEEQLLKL